MILTLSLLSSKSTFSEPFKEKMYISEVLRIGSAIIFHLSELWKAKFSILCDVLLLVRLQEKVDIDYTCTRLTLIQTDNPYLHNIGPNQWAFIATSILIMNTTILIIIIITAYPTIISSWLVTESQAEQISFFENKFSFQMLINELGLK